MNLIEYHDLLIRQKIQEMQKGSESGLVDIFGDDWEQIGGSGQKKNFGRQFKAAVNDHKYSDIEWVRIKNSGRYDVYRKL